MIKKLCKLHQHEAVSVVQVADIRVDCRRNKSGGRQWTASQRVETWTIHIWKYTLTLWRLQYTVKRQRVRLGLLQITFSFGHLKRIAVPWIIQSVPLATEPRISLIILPLMRILQRNLKQTYLVVQEMWHHIICCSNFVAVSSLVSELLNKCRVR